jgi:hypothetical protein
MTSAPDIILGVARAADTVKNREAVSRLERLSQQVAGVGEASAQPADPALAWSAEVQRAAAGTRQATALATPAGATLQNMIEAMMPEDAEAVFGTGTAGSIWKSMLAEKVAAEVARTGTLGIAKQIAAGPNASTAAATSTRSKVDDA